MSSRPSKDAVVRSTFRGMVSNYATVFTEGALQLLVLILLARLLAPTDFGLVASAMIAVELANLLSQFGIRVAVIRHPNLDSRLIRAAFTISMLLALVSMAALWVGAPAVGLFFRSEIVVDLLRVLSVRFLLGGVGRVAEALLERNLAWRKVMYVGMASYALGYAVPACVLAVLGFGAWSLVGAYLGQALLRNALVLALQPHPKALLLRGSELREVFRFGGEYTVARFFAYLALHGDYLIVGRVLGPELLGFYTRAFKLIEIPVNYFAQVIAKVLLPIMARIQDEPHRLRTTYLTGSAVVTLVSAPLSAVMIMTAPEIVQVLLGPAWSTVTAPFQALALGVMFRNGYILGTTLDGALGAMSQRAARNAIYATAVFAGALIGTRYGLMGVAVGVLIAVVLHYALTAGLSLRLIGGSWVEYLESQAPGVVLALTVVALAIPVRAWLRWLELPPLAILTGVALLSATWVVGVLLTFPGMMGRYGAEAMRVLLGLVTPTVPLPPVLVRHVERGLGPALENGILAALSDRGRPAPSLPGETVESLDPETDLAGRPSKPGSASPR